MPDRIAPFTHSLFPFVADNLAAHRNPVTCLLSGLDRPLRVFAGGEVIEGDMVMIRPGIAHSVEIGGRAKVLYFDGMAFPLDADVAGAVPKPVSSLAIDALAGHAHAITDLRDRLVSGGDACSPKIAEIVRVMTRDPMRRMSQTELAYRAGMERTRALRLFKASTGMTFRAFKNWIGLQAAAKQISEGALVRTAAMDSGFSDSAHLARAFRTSFGTTPSDATADRRA
jgi:AraC-like DNA-binding protein